MKLSDARIGYDGYSRDFSAPGDRRRFRAYAAAKGLAFERADLAKDYDVVIVTHNGDIPGWTARKQRNGDRLRFVFELADSYFVQTNPIRRWLKGAARYALGVDTRLSPDFLCTLIRACEAADAVICSTEEQRQTILRYNPKVFTSFDDFGGDLGPPKIDYSRSGKLKLVWEGQSVTLRNIQALREVLNALRDRVQLHVVTDSTIPRYFGRFGGYPAQDALRGIKHEVTFHRWERDSFSSHITAADAAIIPIDTADPMMRGKPENKLVMMWQLGMPVLTSDTPAYRRAMEWAGLDMICAEAADWGRKLEQLIDAPPGELERLGRQGRAFAEQAFSKEEFLRRFDATFEGAGFSL